MAHVYQQLECQYTETINKCLYLQMDRIEMDCNLKNLGNLFKLFPHFFNKSVLMAVRFISSLRIKVASSFRCSEK